MSNLLRYIAIVVLLIVAAMLVLAVGGVLSSTELWHNVVKVAELAGIMFVTAAGILLLTKTKD